jgi:hypothetical protein
MLTLRAALLLVGCLVASAGASQLRGLALHGLHGTRSLAVELSGSSMSRAVPPYEQWVGDYASVEEDPLAYVAPLLAQQEREAAAAADGEMSALQVAEGTGATKVHAFCEICIMIMQMKERGQPHLCAGLNPDYFISVRPAPPPSPFFSSQPLMGRSDSRAS